MINDKDHGEFQRTIIFQLLFTMLFYFFAGNNEDSNKFSILLEGIVENVPLQPNGENEVQGLGDTLPQLENVPLQPPPGENEEQGLDDNQPLKKLRLSSPIIQRVGGGGEVKIIN
jgi:hypothetical protein